jgi:hypothetical protein
MNLLRVQHNELTYTASFKTPLFALWGVGAPLLSSLYESLAPIGIALSNIRTEEASKSPADQCIVIQAGNCVYRWRIERIEVTLNGFSTADLNALPGLLEANDQWMKKSGAPPAYASRQFSYAGHFQIDGAAAGDVLSRVPHLDLGEGFEAKPGGQILHWQDQNANWTGQLVVDHSQAVANGLFLLYSGVSASSELGYDNLLKYIQEVLGRLLTQFALQLEDQ